MSSEHFVIVRDEIKAGRVVLASVFYDKYGRYAKDPAFVSGVIVQLQDLGDYDLSPDEFNRLDTYAKNAILDPGAYLAPPNTEDSNA